MSISAELLEEWDYDKNGDPGNYTRWSKKKVWWVCKNEANEVSRVGGACGCHVWEAALSERSRGSGCPYCCNKKVCIHSSIVTTHPKLAEEWDPMNKKLPSQVSAGCNDKVSWICKSEAGGACGCHIWESKVANRVSGNGCPYCCNKKLCIHNSLVYTHPEIAEEWDPMNKKLPSQVSAGSHDKVSWICKNNVCGCHIWQATIFNRVYGGSCPYCATANRKPCIHTSLAVTHPKLVEEWDYSKNTINPDQVGMGSRNKIFWICKNNVCGCHMWKADVRHRTAGAGCPYCSNQKVCIHTSLQTTHPEIAKEWDYLSGRNKKRPCEISHGSGKKASWICKQGHTWEAIVNSRSRGSGCPKCVSTSFSKIACKWIEGIMQTQSISIQYAKSPEGEYTLPNSKKIIKVDGYCHSTNTVYEFHGDMWHGNPKVYSPSDINPINGKTYGDLYKATIEKEGIIRSLGYNLVVMWEKDFIQ